MPNKENIESPVTLIGPGRSGTTLVTNIFRQHPEFRAVGETTNLVFTTYRTLEESLPFCGAIRGHREPKEAARDTVHGMLLDLYGSKRPRWFQKPIFLPRIHHTWKSFDAFASWYWDVFSSLFPYARVFTVARDPAETAASIMTRWGNSAEQAFRRLNLCYQLMLYPTSRLQLVLPFRELLDKPEQAVRTLLDFSDTPYHPKCMDAFGHRHAVNPDTERPTELLVPPQVEDLYSRLLQLA